MANEIKIKHLPVSIIAIQLNHCSIIANIHTASLLRIVIFPLIKRPHPNHNLYIITTLLAWLFAIKKQVFIGYNAFNSIKMITIRA